MNSTSNDVCKVYMIRHHFTHSVRVRGMRGAHRKIHFSRARNTSYSGKCSLNLSGWQLDLEPKLYLLLLLEKMILLKYPKDWTNFLFLLSLWKQEKPLPSLGKHQYEMQIVDGQRLFQCLYTFHEKRPQKS